MAKSSTSFKKGHKHSPEALEKIRLANVGRKPSLEARRRMSEAQKRNGNRPPLATGLKRSEETKEKIRQTLTGRPRPQLSGDKCNFWKGGITPINEKIRCSLQYKEWRRAVFERDNYICVLCSQRGGKLNADHIKSFANYPELRLELDNGRTLCEPCHRKTENYGYKSTKSGTEWVKATLNVYIP